MPKSFLTVRIIAATGRAQRIMIFSTLSLRKTAVSVPMAEPARAKTAAMTAKRRFILPLFMYLAAATEVPMELTTLLVPEAMWAGMPQKR